jgi:hypothetical protein
MSRKSAHRKSAVNRLKGLAIIAKAGESHQLFMDSKPKTGMPVINRYGKVVAT